MSEFRCKNCGSPKTSVIDSRRSAAFRIRRRRKCSNCNHRFTTFEISAEEFALFDIDGAMIAKLQRDAMRVTKTIEELTKQQKRKEENVRNG